MKGQKIYVLHKSELSEHMEEYNRIGGPSTVVSFTYDQDYKLAYRGAFFYPFTFHMNVEIPLEDWVVQFARALVAFTEIDHQLSFIRTVISKTLIKVAPRKN